MRIFSEFQRLNNTGQRWIFHICLFERHMAEETIVAFVTGSSRGIRGALARSFSEKGYAVAISYLKSESAAFEVREAINDGGYYMH
jgi:hypothetical protein